MPDGFSAALGTPGLIWIITAGFIASAVRGFAGFGTAMIYLPVAAQFLSPVQAIITLVVMDVFGPLPAVPRARREADWPDLRRLLLGMAMALPLGLYVLFNMPQEGFRNAVSLVSLALLILLMAGLRYRGPLTAPKVMGVGGLAGIMGGAVGIPGPPVILFYMASQHSPAVIRATTMLFLLIYDIAVIGVFALQGQFFGPALWIGLMLVPFVMAGTVLGSALFRPEQERLYRYAAYAIIAASALRGLPIWEG